MHEKPELDRFRETSAYCDSGGDPPPFTLYRLEEGRALLFHL